MIFYIEYLYRVSKEIRLIISNCVQICVRRKLQDSSVLSATDRQSELYRIATDFQSSNQLYACKIKVLNVRQQILQNMISDFKFFTFIFSF